MSLFKLTAPPVPEVDLQASVAKALDILLLPPAVWFAMPIGHVQLSAAQAARLSRIGLKRGLPDILVLHEGRLYGIELKRKGGRLSTTRTVRTARGGLREIAGQVEMFAALRAAGMVIAVCSTLPEVLSQLMDWGVPLRNHR